MTEYERVVCVEGLYEYDDDTEPSIKPMLELLSQWGYWPHAHLQCGTVDFAKAFLREKWSESVIGSVLFFSCHGSEEGITLSDANEEWISLGDLAVFLATECEGGCDQCLVHFSACNVLEDKTAVNAFLEVTRAAAVSGYRTDVGWADKEKPALPLDLMLLNQLWLKNIDFSKPRSYKPKLKNIELDLQRRFGDCQFEIVRRP